MQKLKKPLEGTKICQKAKENGQFKMNCPTLAEHSEVYPIFSQYQLILVLMRILCNLNRTMHNHHTMQLQFINAFRCTWSFKSATFALLKKC